MQARQEPDIYDGPNCDQHAPRWIGSAGGDTDGEWPFGNDGTIRFAVRTPPVTVVMVSTAECPECGCIQHDMGDQSDGKGGWITSWECECEFDWHAWATDEFS